ncbi:(deoxy)nucleoside triphosphate pyrophosphohydrolase [uncultured Chitinophaga sp.]|uniref:(deoxy)nucleoside triphosphate pyrophosphohydrolase n=1 Tax=uncultured Chitinophaga sp. TaxID=339340 RepID=UPI0025FAB8F9|nr:(deoxy)nucleoside triphosphate pyrophosphohydrolase [uncultured Chitinophaga sp.]
MNPINVTCAIVLKEGRVLAAQRSENMSVPLKWEFPGGKIIEGESEEECIMREVYEELNLKIVIRDKLGNSLFNYGNFTVILTPFVVDYVESEIILYEHRQIGWFTRNELKELDWAPADIAILDEFLNSSFIVH